MHTWTNLNLITCWLKTRVPRFNRNYNHDMAHFQEPVAHICQQTSLCILTKNFTNQGRMGIARKTGTKNNYGENDIYTHLRIFTLFAEASKINRHDFLPVECNPLSMEANEYLAYTISRMYPTNIFRCIHSGEGLKHHHGIIQLQENMHGNPERCLMHSSKLETTDEIIGKNADSSSLSVVISINTNTCICSTSSK